MKIRRDKRPKISHRRNNLSLPQMFQYFFSFCSNPEVYVIIYQYKQKGYNEEEPAWTKNITPAILEFPKNKIFVLVNQNVFTGVFALFLMFFHSYSCRNVFIHQYKYLVFGKFQNRRGNIFCSRWFLFIISFLI